MAQDPKEDSKKKKSSLSSSLPEGDAPGSEPQLSPSFERLDIAAILKKVEEKPTLKQQYLNLAIEKRDSVAVVALIEANASVVGPTAQTTRVGDSVKLSPIWAAVTLGRTEILKLLLEAKADPDEPNTISSFSVQRPSLVGAAIGLGDENTVQTLLDGKASLSEQGQIEHEINWRNPLGWSKRIAELLLARKPLVKDSPNMLFNALECKATTDAVRFLLEANASLELSMVTYDWDGSSSMTPLAKALSSSQWRTAQLLLEYKANMGAVKIKEQNAFQYLLTQKRESYTPEFTEFLGPLLLSTPKEQRKPEDWTAALKSLLWKYIFVKDTHRCLSVLLNANASIFSDSAGLAALIQKAKTYHRMHESIVDLLESGLDKRRAITILSGLKPKTTTDKEAKTVAPPAKTYSTLLAAVEHLDLAGVKKLLATTSISELELTSALLVVAAQPDKNALPIVSVLLDAKASPDYGMPPGRTALWQAVDLGRASVVEELLKRSANPNQIYLEESVLEQASKSLSYYDARKVRLLLGYKANFTEEVLKNAIKENDVESVKRMLGRKNHGEAINLSDLLFENGNPETVQALVDAKANLETRLSGCTPLLDSISSTPISSSHVIGLLDAKANVNATNLDNNTTLHLLLEYSELRQHSPLIFHQLVNHVVDARADVGAVNDEKLTPLHSFIKNGVACPKTFSALIAAKADLHYTPPGGVSALTFAQQKKSHEKVFEVLLNPEVHPEPELTARDASSSQALAKKNPFDSLPRGGHGIFKANSMYEPRVIRLALRLAGVIKSTDAAAESETQNDLSSSPS